jgi:hypothetical protein
MQETTVIQLFEKLSDKMDKMNTEITAIKVNCTSKCTSQIVVGPKEWGIIAGIVTVICTTVTGIAKMF